MAFRECRGPRGGRANEPDAQHLSPRPVVGHQLARSSGHGALLAGLAATRGCRFAVVRPPSGGGVSWRHTKRRAYQGPCRATGSQPSPISAAASFATAASWSRSRGSGSRSRLALRGAEDAIRRRRCVLGSDIRATNRGRVTPARHAISHRHRASWSSSAAWRGPADRVARRRTARRSARRTMQRRGRPASYPLATSASHIRRTAARSVEIYGSGSFLNIQRNFDEAAISEPRRSPGAKRTATKLEVHVAGSPADLAAPPLCKVHWCGLNRRQGRPRLCRGTARVVLGRDVLRRTRRGRRARLGLPDEAAGVPGAAWLVRRPSAAQECRLELRQRRRACPRPPNSRSAATPRGATPRRFLPGRAVTSCDGAECWGAGGLVPDDLRGPASLGVWRTPAVATRGDGRGALSATFSGGRSSVMGCTLLERA